MNDTIEKQESLASDQIDKWAQLDFSDKPPVQKPDEKVEIDPDTTQQKLEPIEFDDNEPINIEIGDRPFQKKPLPKLMLGLVGAGVCAVAIGMFISAGSQDASKVLSDNAATPKEETTPSNTPGQREFDGKKGAIRKAEP
jgi:hypothetical protein